MDPVAVLSLVVAVGASGVAIYSARSSARSAAAAEASNAISREALERAHRPAVVPLLESPTFDAQSFAIRVKNIGEGPALNLHGRLAGIVNLRHESAGMADVPAHIGVGERAELTFRPRHGTFTGPDFRVWLYYENVAGSRYWSVFLMSATSQLATELGSGPLPEGLRLPRIDRQRP